VILIGQSDPMNRAGVSEVRLRTDCVRMQGLSAPEAAGYVRATVGRHFEEAAIDDLAELPEARNYLELQELIVALLSHTLTSGRDVVLVEDVRTFAAQSRPEPLPRGAVKKAPAAQVSGKDALKSVLARRSGDTAVDEKEAAAC
jgi:hypothetical protein